MLACGVIALAGLAAYSNTFSVPFLFDDLPSIYYNPSLLNLREALLQPPSGYGITVSGRPVLNFSLAVNYALSGTNVWSYHALNLAIHLLAGLTLFGIVRRTLLRPVLRERLGRDALPLALVMALLWTLHPLQTEAVTYIIQRSESLMGLFYLLTFYCFIRSVESPRPWLWRGYTVVACLLGIATKEVMVTAPVLVFLYDRTFVAGSFRAAWRQHRWLYLGLAATWVPLGWLVAVTGGNRGGTSGFAAGVAPWAYWLTQFQAVAHYLKLAVWPHPLVFEYGTFWVRPVEALPYALIIVPLAVVTVVALWRWPVGGFLGVWFFAILAPTSLVPGTIQMIVEHRMYLPLAAVIALVAGGLANRFGRRSLAALLVLALAAGVLTGRRNVVYRSDLTLWQDTVDKSPNSAIAQSNLGAALYSRGRLKEAEQYYDVSLRLNPNLASIHHNIGLVYAKTDRLAEAVAQYEEAFRLNPRFYPAQYQWGVTLMRMGRPQEALEHFAKTLAIMPNMAEALHGAGLALFKLGRVAEAVGYYEKALQLNPAYDEAEFNLGVALFQMNRVPEAVKHFERALRINPKLAEAHYNLGLALAQTGRLAEAASHYTEAVRLDPHQAEAQLNLGVALVQAGRSAEAREHLEQAVRLKPDLAEAHGNLGIALAEAGRVQEAIGHYEEALRLKPDYAEAHYNLGNALLQLGRAQEARREFEQALRIEPQFDAARDMLKRLQALQPAGDSR